MEDLKIFLPLRPKTQLARSGPPTALACGRRPGHARARRVLEPQSPGRKQRGNFRIAELAEQAKNVAVDRLAPHFLARAEIAADHRVGNARVDRPAVQGEHSPFAVAEHADRRMVLLPAEPIHRRQHFLHLVADDVPAHLVSHAIDELAVRLIGHPAQLRIAGPGILAVDQHRHQHSAAILGQPARELRFLRHAGRQADQHLRCPVRVRQRDHTGHHLAFRFQQQPLAVHARQHRPADRMNLVAIRLRDQRRLFRWADVFHLDGRHPRINDAEDLLQPLAVGLHRFRVCLRRGVVRLPVLLAFLNRRGQFAHQILVDALDHLGGEVALAGERPRIRQRFGAEKRRGQRGHGHDDKQTTVVHGSPRKGNAGGR